MPGRIFCDEIEIEMDPADALHVATSHPRGVCLHALSNDAQYESWSLLIPATTANVAALKKAAAVLDAKLITPNPSVLSAGE